LTISSKIKDDYIQQVAEAIERSTEKFKGSFILILNFRRGLKRLMIETGFCRVDTPLCPRGSVG